MDKERQEVYERIPWERLERPGGDRQWMLIALAGAVAVGALAFSFMKNQPAATADVVVSESIVTPTVAPAPLAVPATSSPMVLAEADLYAVNPERLIDEVRAHAERFAVEYFSVDGSSESAESLALLLPAGVPLPEAPSGIQVFVDWVGASGVVEIAPLTYEATVLVRSLRAGDDGVFVRQPTRVALVEIKIESDGLPVVNRPPILDLSAVTTQGSLALIAVPDQIRLSLETESNRVLGGEQLADGRWRVVVMATGVDGVVRPKTVLAP